MISISVFAEYEPPGRFVARRIKHIEFAIEMRFRLCGSGSISVRLDCNIAWLFLSLP